MRNQSTGALEVPAIVAMGEGIANARKGLKKQVMNQVYRAEAAWDRVAGEDFTGETTSAEAGKWFNRAVMLTGVGLVCWPCLLAAGYCVLRAHRVNNNQNNLMEK